jgi:hypothetical protein
MAVDCGKLQYPPLFKVGKKNLEHVQICFIGSTQLGSSDRTLCYGFLLGPQSLGLVILQYGKLLVSRMKGYQL